MRYHFVPNIPIVAAVGSAVAFYYYYGGNSNEQLDKFSEPNPNHVKNYNRGKDWFEHANGWLQHEMGVSCKKIFTKLVKSSSQAIEWVSTNPPDSDKSVITDTLEKTDTNFRNLKSCLDICLGRGKEGSPKTCPDILGNLRVTQLGSDHLRDCLSDTPTTKCIPIR